MSEIEVIRKANGELIKNSEGRVVFVKNGINFSLDNNEMIQMKLIIEGVLDGSLNTIDTTGITLIKGD